MENYEQKYKEALERASHIKDNNTVATPQEVAEFLFPELKESEDERIRKEIIQSIQDNMCVIHKDKCIAWLEKQGEQKSDPRYNILDKLIEADNIYQMAMNDAMVEEAKNKAIEALSKLEISKLLWFEKQDEQKPADNVEPKFNVGDCVVTSYGKVNQVIAVDEDGDGFTLDDDTYFSGSWKDDYHLWTIQDAKDGDVLANKYGAIFINAGSSHGGGTLNCYCYLSVQNEFCIEERKTGSWFYKEDIKPATKEQSDLLFQKMKEAGYEWNAEKKELKKIESKPTWNEEGERIRKAIVDFLSVLASRKENQTFSSEDFDVDSLNKWVQWLEKQGEQKNEEMPALVCPKCMKSFEKCEDYSVYHDRIRYICPHCGYDGDSVEFETSYKNHPIHNVTPLMIQWKGNNLKQVIEFTGKSPKFNEWFKSFEEYETYVREHNNIFKLFNEDGSNYEMPVGAWIVKTPDGYNVASKAIFKQISNWNEEDEEMFDAIIADIQFTQKAHNHEVNQVVYEREIDWLKSLKDRVQPQPKQEWSEDDKNMLESIIK